jgi:hypothetical protein
LMYLGFIHSNRVDDATTDPAPGTYGCCLFANVLLFPPMSKNRDI